MIGIEYDDGVVEMAALPQRLEHRADGVVDHRDHAAGQRHRLFELALRRHERDLGLGVLRVVQHMRPRPKQGRHGVAVRFERQPHLELLPACRGPNICPAA